MSAPSVPFGTVLSTVFLILSLSAVPFPAAEQLHYGTGKWDPDLLGNHRAVVRVSAPAAAARVRIPWRRRDVNPERKKVLFIDAATGRELKNVCPLAVNREFGDFVFEPATSPGDTYVYYLPNVMTGRSNYPTVVYPEPRLEADPGWLRTFDLSPFQVPDMKSGSVVPAEVIEIQSVDAFNSFFPMEVIATAAETASLLARFPSAAYLVFPEDRRFSIRMADDLPQRWIEAGPQDEFRGEAARGEFYAFQVGVFAARAPIEDLDVALSDLTPIPGSSPLPGRPAIPAAGAHSFNTQGVNWDGKSFKKTCRVPLGKVQPLWCGYQVPAGIPAGSYRGEVTIRPSGLPPARVRLLLTVTSEVIDDAGDSELWRMSRLRWVDSRLAFDDGVVAPFTPLTIEGRTVSCLGRSAELGDDGLIRTISSFFSPEVTALRRAGRELLAAPILLAVTERGKSSPAWKGKGPRFTGRAAGAVTWEAESRSGPLALACRGRMEADGFLEFKLELTADSRVEVDDIRLEIPLAAAAARYMMGLGFRGGRRPSRFEWVWDQKKNQDALWIGDVNAGLQVNWRDENYSRPLNTNFYLSKPLNLPPSWWNGGKGRCTVGERNDGAVLVTASSGPRRIEPGEVLHFNFNLLLTPFKLIDPKAHFTTRYFHSFQPVEEVAKTGANTINVHHANAINPYINYPFLRPDEMKKYIDEAHARGMKVKIYDTIRELSNHCVELFALRSLGDEVFSPGAGGGFSWLQEHLGSDYIPAWFVPELKDAAIINSGLSRWHNYYLEGLNWLVKNIGLDGLYLDDVAFDRTTMKRIRKILDRSRPGCLIDLHSANQYNPRDGFASSANLYLEHFPYLNRLWFGEYFDYDSAPDYWLVEISGIPFGLLGEMLQDGGNPWRGMIYGMTNRLPWSGQNPARIWRVWDDFGIAEAKMVGYWSDSCPVRTDNPDVLATVYSKEGSALVSLASWAPEPVSCRLKFDWESLGLTETAARLRAPGIPDFQPERSFRPGDLIPVEPGKGWLLMLEKNEQ